MIWSHGDCSAGPDPKLLAAYVDGELEGNAAARALRKRVEDWLTSHPEAAADLAAQRRLTELWRAAAPAEPERSAWAGVLKGVRQRLNAEVGQDQRRPWARRLIFGAVGGLAAAATLIWALLPLLQRETSPGTENTGPGVPQATAAETVTPLLVASEDEIEILHVQGADTSSLAVGSLPVNGPLVLAGPGDVALKSVQPAGDKMVPDMVIGQTAPMIWARLEGERAEP